jgi:hypothetical protein
VTVKYVQFESFYEGRQEVSIYFNHRFEHQHACANLVAKLVRKGVSPIGQYRIILASDLPLQHDVSKNHRHFEVPFLRFRIPLGLRIRFPEDQGRQSQA